MRKLFLMAAAVALLAVSCTAPKQVPYFQDITDADNSFEVHPLQLVLQPEDKISIIVSCKDPQLSSLFNLQYAARTIGSSSESVTGGQQGTCGYTIDSKGNIDFPVLGIIAVGGLTREQVSQKIKSELVNRNLVKDPVVTVDFLNLMFTVLGDVSGPGRYAIPRDHMNILDAIAMAGDLSVTGQRENVMVIREKDGQQVSYTMNLCSMKELVDSPAYYIQQNDIIYVEPNKMKSRQSTVNGNNLMNVSFWMSFVTFVSSFIIMFTK